MTGGIYERGNRLSIWWFTGKMNEKTGKPERKFKGTGLLLGEEEKAQKALAIVLQRAARELETGVPEGELTVRGYGEMWLKAREAAGKDVQDDAHHLRLHIFPLIGKMLFKDVVTRHARDVARKLPKRISRRGTPLAPRSVHNIVGTMHTMFHDGVVDGEIAVNPCVFKEDDLPDRLDKNPLWRNTAIFTRAEVEQIISDERIPEDRRVFYAFAFLAGLRFGETSALRWSVYDPLAEPLGKLHVAVSFDSAKKIEEPVKNGVPRNVPVHSALAKVLARWKLSGFEAFMGRRPEPDDLIVPTVRNRHRRNTRMLKLFNDDLAVLGLRRRRQHDARRAFITYGRSDCTRDHIFKWISHGPSKKMLDVYSTFPWTTLCEEILPLKLRLLEGRVLPLVAVATGSDGPRQPIESTGNGPKPCDSVCDSGKIPTNINDFKSRSTGLETVPFTHSENCLATNSTDLLAPRTGGVASSDVLGRSTVTLSHAIGLALEDTRRLWVEAGDVETLRNDLARILEAAARLDGKGRAP